MKFRNSLLSALPEPDVLALLPSLTEVTLQYGQALFEVGDRPQAVYFPSSAVVSVVTVMRDGRTAESNTIGRESGVALLNAAGDVPLESRVFVQIGGGALKLPASVLRHRLSESPALSALFLRHLHASLLQTQQFLACNLLHNAEQRLARWLLMTADRTGGPRFSLTQDYMAVMTGVQRSTVSLLASGLRDRGLIAYSRGQVQILDVPGLTAAACECAAVAHSQFEALRSDG